MSYEIEYIRAFLRKAIAKLIGSEIDICNTTSIYHDLHIGGDDAAELLSDIYEKFEVDFFGFKFDEYFPNETEAFLSHIALLFGFKSKKKRLTIEHLLKVIKLGHWFDDEQVAEELTKS